MKLEISDSELHKVGKWGSIETNRDEIFSKDIVSHIYEDLCAFCPIDGYEYVLWETIEETAYYSRDISGFSDSTNTYGKIVPDSYVIVLRSINNPKEWHLVLCAEDKNQETKGNAIERFAKNYNVMRNLVCGGTEILPYLIFCTGEGLVGGVDGEFNDYMERKFRQTIGYVDENHPSVWSVKTEHSIFKKRWNMAFVKKEHFTYDEKKEALVNAVQASVKYYSVVL